MTKITLARALKLKNLLAGKLAKVQLEISQFNSVVEGTEQPDIRALLSAKQSLSKHLVDLKTEHYKANLGIQRVLYDLAETKSTLAFFNALQTFDGDSGSVHYGTTVKLVRKAIVKKDEKDKMVAELESRIEAMQEQVDSYNYSTSISVDDSLLQAAGVKIEKGK